MNSSSIIRTLDKVVRILILTDLTRLLTEPLRASVDTPTIFINAAAVPLQLSAYYVSCKQTKCKTSSIKAIYICKKNTQNMTTMSRCLTFRVPYKGNYTPTSNNMKLVHWPLMGGLLHLVQQRGDWAGPQLAHTPPQCTK